MFQLVSALISALYICANLVAKAIVEQKNKSQTRRTRSCYERQVVPLCMDDLEGAMENLLHGALPPPETRQWWAFWGLVDDDRRVWVGPESSKEVSPDASS
jgi:hypothetical protein